MDKQNVEYIYNEFLLCHKKDQNSYICYNMDESGKHYAKWNKPETKEKILYDYTYMKYKH